MVVPLGSNISALSSIRQLGRSSDELYKVYERLSSGQRINRASDDAAGLAIADSLRTDSRLYTTALRNISDGQSVLSIMDGGLEAQSSVLQRMIELAEQAANGTYTSEQRDALSVEYEALKDELGRIAESTEFNGQRLLSSSEPLVLQVGINGDADSLISITTQDAGSFTGTLALADDPSRDGRISAIDGSLQANSTTLEELAEFSQNKMGIAQVESSNGETREVLFSLHHGETLLGAPIYALAVQYYDRDSEAYALASAIFSNTVLASDDPASITADLTFFDTGATATLTVDLSGFDLSTASESEVGSTAIDLTNIKGQSFARQAVDIASNRLEEIASLRAEIGAAQSRLGTARDLVLASREEAHAAESRIREADVAAEVGRLVRFQILQQTAAAVLGQANEQPALALDLLRG